MGTSPVYVGVDVAKARLDLAVRPTGEQWSVPNEEAGITGNIAQLQALAPTPGNGCDRSPSRDCSTRRASPHRGFSGSRGSRTGTW
jgi:hypothetical protein